MANLTRIYTRTGDHGTTRLANNSTVPKSEARLEALGSVDEANCAIGLALAQGLVDPGLGEILQTIQQQLFEVGADLATPLPNEAEDRARRVDPAWVDRLEAWCDDCLNELPDLPSFVLPGGSALAGWLQLARAIVRRAERAAWRAAETVTINPTAIRYLNRLSDLLFLLARRANQLDGTAEALWAPTEKERG